MLTQAKKIAKQLVYRGGSPYYYMRKWSEVASTPKTYFQRRKIGSQLASQLTDSDQSVVDSVRRIGFAQMPEPLPLTQELVTESNACLAEYLAQVGEPSTNMGIAFMSTLLRKDQVGPDSIFVRFAAQDRLMAMAAAYLGDAPYLSGIELVYSFPQPGEFWATQHWHRDYDDTRMFKVFVYCSDVEGLEDGALHVADKNALKGIYASPLYSSRRFSDEKFFKMADPADVKLLCGPAGSTFICDTRQSFHYGSRCTRLPRLAIFITYQHYAGLYPANHVTDPAPGSTEVMQLLLSKTPN